MTADAVGRDDGPPVFEIGTDRDFCQWGAPICGESAHRILDGKGFCRQHFRLASEREGRRFTALLRAGLTRSEADLFIRRGHL